MEIKQPILVNFLLSPRFSLPHTLPVNRPEKLEFDDFDESSNDSLFRRIRFSLLSLLCFLLASLFGVYSLFATLASQIIGFTCVCTIPGLFFARAAGREEERRREEEGEGEEEGVMGEVARRVPIVSLVLNALALLVFTAAQVCVRLYMSCHPCFVC